MVGKLSGIIDLTLFLVFLYLSCCNGQFGCEAFTLHRLADVLGASSSQPLQRTPLIAVLAVGIFGWAAFLRKTTLEMLVSCLVLFGRIYWNIGV